MKKILSLLVMAIVAIQFSFAGDVIQVTFFNRLIINYLHNCVAYNMPTFLIYYRLFLT